MRRIYLDNAATMRILSEVLEAMQPAYEAGIGNPSSVHREGQHARQLLEEGREKISSYLGCHPSEIFFTSGGTESDNWAIRGLSSVFPSRKHIITSAIEHPAVLNSCKALEAEGYRVTYLPVDQYGMVSVSDLKKYISDETSLVSIMLANNEIGTIEPVSELAGIAHEYGALFHTDSVQAVGTIPVSFEKLNVDAASFSSHKFGGPAGIGGLYIRNGVKISSLIFGGEQERGFRAGTENLPGVLGLSKALELALEDMETKTRELSELRDLLISKILSEIPGTELCGHPQNRLPGNVHLVFDQVDGEALLLYLNTKGYACSSGSACSSGTKSASHVLRAIGLSDQMARSALRISMSSRNTEEEVMSIVPVLKELVGILRKR